MRAEINETKSRKNNLFLKINKTDRILAKLTINKRRIKQIKSEMKEETFCFGFTDQMSHGTQMPYGCFEQDQMSASQEWTPILLKLFQKNKKEGRKYFQ